MGAYERQQHNTQKERTMRFDIILEKIENGQYREKVVESVHEDMTQGILLDELIKLDTQRGWKVSGLKVSAKQ